MVLFQSLVVLFLRLGGVRVGTDGVLGLTSRGEKVSDRNRG